MILYVVFLVIIRYMGTKLYIKTYGCQMNEYDSQKTLEILKQDPTIEETSNPEEADIILLNTCSIREKAEEKVYSELGRLRKLKIENPNLKIGVGGCVASQEGKNIFKRAPYKYKQQAVENQSIICQMETQPASWTTAAANFFFTLRASD